MDKLKFYIFILLLLALQSCETHQPVHRNESQPALKFGDDVLIDSNLTLISGKNIAIVANKASVLSDGTSLLDTLLIINNIKIRAVFTPEHGYDINSEAGKPVGNSAQSDIPFYSLYGKNKKPAAEMLKDIDVVLFDLQDVGTRFYTYISTLFYVLEAAGENNIPVIVLDRPDPIGGNQVAGPVLDPEFQSFVGIAPVPVIYGMTCGELAQLFVGEGMLSAAPDLTVIRMKNWKRKSYFDEYELEWINPSPNLTDFETALIYPSTAFLEGTNISVGRGTKMAYKQIGAPFINSEDLMKGLNAFQHEGISIEPASFTPLSIPGMAENPKYENIKCNGILLHVIKPSSFKPMIFSIQLLYVLHKLYPEKLKFESAFFDKLTGGDNTRKLLETNREPDEIINSWKPDLENFLKIRDKYLLY